MKPPRVLLLTILLLTTLLKAQCPLDIDESTIAPTNNLLLHLPFDGNLNNLGSGNYSITNSGAQYVPTQCGQGLFFDGVNDFVNVSPSMNLINDFTICTWISPNSQVDWMGIFSIREQCASTYRGYSILQFNLGDYNVSTLNNQVNIHQNCTGFSAGDRYTNTGILIPNNVETFVALSVQNNSSENRIVTLYVNCAEYSTSMTIDFPTAVCFGGTQNYTTTIGASSGVTNHTSTFHGTIDQLRVYDVVLNHEQILDVYQSCLPVSVDVAEFPDCNADSAQITIFNTELDVNYQLINTATNTPIGSALPGNCGPLVFNTGIYTATTQFEIQATNTVSNCSIMMDSIITLSPSINSLTSTQNLTLCVGDSIQMGSGYITGAGTYNDTIQISPTCDSIITLNVSEISPYTLDLGPDIQICPNTNQTIAIASGADSYLWQDGAVSNSYQVTQPGTYWVTVTDQCGIYSDTLNITAILDTLDLGPDTLFCQGTTLILDATMPSGIYTWQDNSMGNVYPVSVAGSYWVEVSSMGCTFTDTINISIEQSPFVDLGTDTTICDGDIISLTPTVQSADNLLWSTNATSNSIDVATTGMYILEASNQCGTVLDSVYVTVAPAPTFNLGNDTTLCFGNTMTLTVNIPNVTTLWHDGSQLNTFIVVQPGVYWAIASNQGCDFQDEIHVTYTEAPEIQLGSDTVICDGEQYILTIPSSNGSILWNNGSQESMIVVTQEGIYSVSVTNNCGQDSDQIEIQTTNCSCEIYVPNSFTPDDGKFNETFGPVHECQFLEYSLRIFNRWGEVIFESTDPLEMWNASYLGKKVQSGTYTYHIQYDLEDDDTDEIYVINGHVNVLY